MENEQNKVVKKEECLSVCRHKKMCFAYSVVNFKRMVFKPDSLLHSITYTESKKKEGGETFNGRQCLRLKGILTTYEPGSLKF